MAIGKPKTDSTALNGITLKPLLSADSSPVTSESLWAERPALVFLVRRLGCQLCRNHAQLLSGKTSIIKDELGFDMIGITHQTLDAEDFVKGYWKHPLYHDEEKSMYKAIGGGELRMASLLDLLKLSTWKNMFDANRGGAKGNMQGEGM